MKNQQQQAYQPPQEGTVVFTRKDIVLAFRILVTALIVGAALWREGRHLTEVISEETLEHSISERQLDTDPAVARQILAKESHGWEEKEKELAKALEELNQSKGALEHLNQTLLQRGEKVQELALEHLNRTILQREEKEKELASAHEELTKALDELNKTKGSLEHLQAAKLTNITSLDLLPRVPHVTTWEMMRVNSTNASAAMRPLNFVHIPKTGGSSVVQAGINHNISWGDCLFKGQWPGRICPQKPPQEYPMEKNGVVPWHLPVQYLRKDLPNPYDGFDLFAVVRNPYERAISEVYYRCKIFKNQCQGLEDDVQGPRVLNDKIQTASKQVLNAKKASPEYYLHWAHWVPQYDFFHDEQSNRRVQHLLHNEFLKEEFESLMQAFNMTVRLPHKPTKTRKESGAKWDVSHLTLQTLKLIEIVYEKDFELGGYSMINSGSLAPLNK